MWKAERGARLETSAAWRYGLPVISVAVALAATYLLQPYVFRTPLLFLAIMISTWVGGKGPGLLATLLATLSVSLFLNPHGVLETHFHHVPNVAAFLLTSLMVGAWSATRRRAEFALQQARDELETKVEERTADLSRTNEQLRKEVAERKLAEEKVRHAEEQAHKLLDTIPQQIWSGPADGTLDYCNYQWRAYAGLGLEEIQGDGWQRMLHPDDKERVLRAWSESVATGKLYEQEERHRRADGAYRWFLCRGVPMRDAGGRIERWFGTNTDITERRRAEEEVRRRKEIFQKIFDNAPITLSFFDESGHLSLVNPEWERTFGWTVKELDERNLDIIAECFPDEAERQQVREFLAAGTGEWGEFKIRTKDGRTLDVWGAVVRVSDGTSVGLAQDITERKRAEEAAKASEERLRLTFEAAKIGTGEMDLQTNQITLSDAMQRVVGLAPGTVNLSFEEWVEVIYPEDRASVRQAVESSIDGNPDIVLDYRIVWPDGSVHWVTSRARTFYDEAGRATRMVGAIMDITQRKRAEEELRKEKEVLQKIFDNAPVALNFFDEEGRLLLVNRVWERMYGWTLKELEERNLDIYAEALPDPRYIRRAKEFVMAASGEWADFKIRTRDGRMIDGLGAVVRLSDGTRIGILQDITERRRAEEELREREELMRVLTENANDFIRLHDIEGRSIYASPSVIRLYGQAPTVLFEFAHPEDMEACQRWWKQVVAGGSQRLQWRVRDGGGNWRWLETTASRFQFKGRPHVLTVCRDITEGKLAEEALRQSENLWRTIFDNAAIGIAIVNPEGRPVETNPAFQKILGYTKEELLRLWFVDFTHPDDTVKELPLHQEMIDGTRDHYQMEKRYIRKDGQVRWVNLIASVIPAEQPEEFFGVGMVEDITDRKRAEEALRASEERLEGVLNSLNDVVWSVALPEFKLTFQNRAAEAVYGRPRSEFFANDNLWLEVVHPADRERVEQSFQVQMRQGERDLEYRILRPDGEVRWLHDRARLVRDQAGAPIRLDGIATDITERKLADEALRESQQLYESLVQSIDGIVAEMDGQTLETTFVSKQAERFLGYPVQRWTEEPDFWMKIMHPDDLAWVVDTKMRAVAEGENRQLEFRMIAADGRVVWFSDLLTLHVTRDGSLRQRGVMVDITKRKLAEEQLTRSNEELRALSARLHSVREEESARIAREIHDELGGSLSSLKWDLEGLEESLSEAADSRQPAALREKVAGMITLTDNTVDAVRRIASELRPTALEEFGLVEAIRWHAQQFQARTGIAVHCDCPPESAELSREQATAVFRIVQEALTNVMRHAQATRVDIRMSREGDRFALTVSDNGRGITDSEKSGGRSLGLLGMRERAHLLGGEISIEGAEGRGTVVTLRVPADGRAEGTAQDEEIPSRILKEWGGDLG